MSTRAAVRSSVPVVIATFLITIIGILPVTANSTPQTLPFGQDWSNTALISADDNWTNVPGGTSPYTNPINGAQQFFRLISN